ncbi:isoamylase early set domain-containing protein [bacterium]
MSLRKRYLKGNQLCKVTFVLDNEVYPFAKTVQLVGVFNNWSKEATPMKQLKNGTFSVSVNLKAGNEYSFRYLINGTVWINDWLADKFEPTIFGDVENSIIVV